MSKVKEFGKNVSYSLIANVVNLVVSTLTAILIPILFKENIEGYGYYQIYLFYVAYVGFFHLGLCDGFLLRNAGKNIDSLNSNNTSFQFWVLSLFELFISLITVLVVFLTGVSTDYLNISIAFGINLIIFLPRNYICSVLQSANLHKQNALVTIIGRSMFMLIVGILLVLKVTNYAFYMYGDIVGKMFALLYGLLACRKLIFKKVLFSKSQFKELFINIKSGSKIMLAGISSLVVTGVVRLLIQSVWDVETYGKISLVLTISSLVLSFVTAVSIVLFPSLKTVDEEKQIRLYPILKNLLLPILMCSIFLSYPGFVLMKLFLPQYIEGIRYIAYVFPICFFSAKASLLVQTYMQINRMENKILIANLISIFVSISLSLIFILWLKNLSMALPIILICQVVRCIASELFLKRDLDKNRIKDIIIEFLIIGSYLTIYLIWGDLISFISFFGIFALYIIIKHKEIVSSYKYLFSKLKKTEESVNE